MKVLILEDDAERAIAFRRESANINPKAEVVLWQSAHKMCEDLPSHLPAAILISLDHDLRIIDGHSEDPGSGMDVAKALSSLSPICPVIVHTSNTNASWSMVNELTHSGWRVERAGPVSMGTEWVRTVWAPMVRQLTATSKGKRITGEAE